MLSLSRAHIHWSWGIVHSGDHFPIPLTTCHTSLSTCHTPYPGASGRFGNEPIYTGAGGIFHSVPFPIPLPTLPTYWWRPWLKLLELFIQGSLPYTPQQFPHPSSQPSLFVSDHLSVSLFVSVSVSLPLCHCHVRTNTLFMSLATFLSLFFSMALLSVSLSLNVSLCLSYPLSPSLISLSSPATKENVLLRGTPPHNKKNHCCRLPILLPIGRIDITPSISMHNNHLFVFIVYLFLM